MYSLHHVLIM